MNQISLFINSRASTKQLTFTWRDEKQLNDYDTAGNDDDM